MESERWSRVQELFEAAADLRPPERELYLAGECAGDGVLRQEVESLLRSDAEAGSFIERAILRGSDLLLAAEPDPLESIGKIGKYEILGRIGEGGFGVVYKGRDAVLQRFVAVKTCSSSDQKLRRRFFREGQIAAGLQHPNITTVHDLGVEHGIPYLVQEFLEGEDLNHKIARQEPLTALQRLDVLAQVARGLEYAHSQGVLHRDVKPANIRILPSGGVKIMDFGIAKLLHDVSDVTTQGVTLGTVGYLAPEQLRGEEVDRRTDVFSFGVLVYELLTYERPFKGSTFSEVSYRLLNEQPRALRDLAPTYSRAIAELVNRCLAKDPSWRCASFGEVIGALEPEIEALRSGAFRVPVEAASPAAADGPGAPGPLPDAIAGSWAAGAAVPARPAAAVGEPGAGGGWREAAGALPAPGDGGAQGAAGGAPRREAGPAGQGGSAALPDAGTRAPRRAGIPGRAAAPLATTAAVALAVLGLGGWVVTRHRPAPSAAAAAAAAAPAGQAATVRPAVSGSGTAQAAPGAAPVAAPGEPGGAAASLEGARRAAAPRQLPRPRDDAAVAHRGATAVAGAPAIQGAPGVTGRPAGPGRPGGREREAGAPPPAVSPSLAEAGGGEVSPAAPGAAGTAGGTSTAPAPSPDSPAEGSRRSPAGEDDPGVESAPGAAGGSAAPPGTRQPMERGDLIVPGTPGVSPPRLLSRPEPQYPDRARRRRAEADVLMLVLVDETGRVVRTIVKRTDDANLGFNEAARQAALRATFQPPTRDGIPGKMWTELPFSFRFPE
jgi:TonB family protein